MLIRYAMASNKALLFFLRAGHEDRAIGLPVSYSLFLATFRVVAASSLSEAHGHPMRQKATRALAVGSTAVYAEHGQSGSRSAYLSSRLFCSNLMMMVASLGEMSVN
jgi:hypothetical protein